MTKIIRKLFCILIVFISVQSIPQSASAWVLDRLFPRIPWAPQPIFQDPNAINPNDIDDYLVISPKVTIWGGCQLPLTMFEQKKQCNHLRMMKEKTAQKHCTNAIFKGTSPQTTQGLNELLKSKMCLSRVPTKADQVFEPNTDVPADFINHWTSERIQREWEPQLQWLSDRMPNINLNAFYIANRDAADLWNLMLKCTQGESEKARHNYYTGRWHCHSLSPISGVDLKLQISNYIANVSQILLTAIQPEDVSQHFDQGPYYSTEKLATHAKKFLKTRTEFPTMHPLFLQAAYQILIEGMHFHNYTNIKDLNQKLVDNLEDEQLHRLTYSLDQLHFWIPNKPCSHLGLWPVANRAVHFRVHRALIQMQFAMHPGLRQVLIDFGAIDDNCNIERLPRVYHSQHKKITKQMAQINAIYGVHERWAVQKGGERLDGYKINKNRRPISGANGRANGRIPHFPAQLRAIEEDI